MLAAAAAAVLQACFVAKTLQADGPRDVGSGPACMLPGRVGQAPLPVHVPCLRRHRKKVSVFDSSGLVRHTRYLGVKLLRQMKSAQRMYWMRRMVKDMLNRKVSKGSPIFFIL